MCINNATQLVIKKMEDGVPIAEQVEKIARELMNVAVHGLTRWEEDQIQKDQNDKPSEEKPNNEDVPF